VGELPANVRCHLLPWDRPLLPQAVAWLAGEWSGNGPLDLSHVLAVVPTRQSGRRLRAGLAEHAAAAGSAVLAPRVIVPEQLVAIEADAAVASPLEVQLAWADVLGALDLEAFRAVFPIDPPGQSFAWAVRLGQQFSRLQRTLGEGSLRLADVAARAGSDFPETDRWQQLGELEQRYDHALRRRALADPQAARMAAATAGSPEGITRIIVLAVPDPTPLALGVLAAWARQLIVDVVIFGPPGENPADLFDGWGRPRTEAWSKRPLALERFRERVHLCADPVEQAERVAALVERYRGAEGMLAVGLADAEVAPALEHRLRAAGFAAFNPEGRPERREGFFALLSALATLGREQSFGSVAALIRCPDFLAWLLVRDRELSPAAVLEQIDALRARHLPATLAAARDHATRFPLAARALAAVAELVEILTRGEFPANAAATLAELFRAAHGAESAALADSAAGWMDWLRAAERAAANFPGVATADWWDLVLAAYGETVHPPERPEGAIELLGWLELLFEDAPHLVVAGLNDGRVPEAIVGDAFLPEALRAVLGLKTNAARFARDAFLLAALAASRSGAGILPASADVARLDLLVGKVSAAGDPLRPSRLLLQCPDPELPARVEFLFRPAEATRPSPAWRRAWQLTPGAVAPLARVSVTAFRDYLRCPFRFYLKHGLRMELVDPEKSEMDARDFGTLCHTALEGLGTETALRECRDPAALREYLLAALDRAARARFGRELSLPLLVQLESARQRLSRAAEVQAAERAAGWVIERVEWPLPDTAMIGGLALRGRIDRVERHEATGAIRVLDYKTSDKPVRPQDAHCRRVRPTDTAPPFARFSIGGEDLVWTDLQLPLYLAAIAEEFGAHATAGYFNLPKASGETAIAEWPDYTDEWRDAARRCAEGVVAAIRAGEFWPPAELPANEEADEFAGLFHHGATASAQWTGAALRDPDTPRALENAATGLARPTP
jgi:ATP-dependent helicase/nuclease subunit B